MKPTSKNLLSLIDNICYIDGVRYHQKTGHYISYTTNQLLFVINPTKKTLTVNYYQKNDMLVFSNTYNLETIDINSIRLIEALLLSLKD